MKRMLLAGALAFAAAGPVLAADLPQPPPAPRAPAAYVPVVPIYSWTGIYIGLNGGYAFGTATDAAGILTPAVTANGFLAGGTVGGNYQFGAFVVGLEADGDWSNLDGNDGIGEVKSTWLATARGRAGWAWDRVLFYGTAGTAFGNVQAGGVGGPFDSATQVGWTGGAGVEAAFAPNWSVKIEYLFVNLGNLACVAHCPAGDTVNLTENVVRAGLNFKFGAW